MLEHGQHGYHLAPTAIICRHTPTCAPSHPQHPLTPHILVPPHLPSPTIHQGGCLVVKSVQGGRLGLQDDGQTLWGGGGVGRRGGE